MKREEWLRALDALVEEHVYGHEIVGHTKAWGECEYDTAEAEPGPHPVYVAECLCETVRECHRQTVASCIETYGWDDETVAEVAEKHAAEWIYGHHWQCFGVARSYSRSIADAWTLVERLEADGWWWDARSQRNQYESGPRFTLTKWDGREIVQEEWSHAPTLPLAIVKICLRAKGIEPPPEPEP